MTKETSQNKPREAECPAAALLARLREGILSGSLTQAYSRQRLIEIEALVEEITFGRAGPDHLQALEKLARTAARESADEPARKLAGLAVKALENDREVFQNHIDTHNCATGECPRLAPAPCQMACPAGIDVPSYVTLIGQGRDAEAIELIRKDNPFPWICGLVCTNPCEFMCVRGRIDEPVAIKHLKAFAAERAMSRREYVNPEPAPPNGRKVCILGAGPAGMTAAYYLGLRGCQVTVIEGLPSAGGMMLVGIPRYRLPREVIDREAAMIESLGVEFRFNTYVGADVTLEGLREEGFEVFLAAMGAHSCLDLRIPGEKSLRPVIPAVSLLHDAALGERHLPGRRAAVVGGGNVAIDAARTAIRLGAEEVHVVYRRTRSEMPANIEEIEQAEEEGVRFSFLTAPVAVIGQDGVVTGLKCLRTELGPPDESGRRRPAPVEGSEYILPVETVIPAIGQSVHPGGLLNEEGLRWSRRGTIVVDTASMAAKPDGFFAAGDGVTGPATVVEAIGGGKRAAEAVHRLLSGLPQPKMPPPPVRRARLESLEVSAPTKMIIRRPEMPHLGLERRRVTFQQVELGYSENAVREEARRCLRCDICLRCGRCAAVCRDKMGVDALALGYMDFDHPGPTDFRLTAERCIGCGACAANCPTGAMTIEDRDGERVLSLCGTVLNRLALEYCVRCGEVLGPARYHDYIAKMTEGAAPSPGGERLCLKCARDVRGRSHAEIEPPARSAGE